MNCNIRRFAFLTAVLLLRSQMACAAPIQPAAPVAGWLYDETYSGFGSTIKDSFGSMNGLTAGATSGTVPAVGGPSTASDAPFAYAGNNSFSTVGGPGTGDIWFGNFGVGPYRTLVNGASAVTVSAWLKYQDGALTTSGSTTSTSGNNTNNNANAFLAMTLDGTKGGSGLYLNLPTGTTGTTGQTGDSNKNKLSVIGTSITADAEQKYVTTGTLIPGSWNHIVAVLDFQNDQIRVSINGGAFETGAANFGSNTFVAGGTLGTTPDIIPSRSPNSEYIGLLDEVAIWNTALTADNVEWLQQNSLNAVPEPGALILASFGSLAFLRFARLRHRSLIQ